MSVDICVGTDLKISPTELKRHLLSTPWLGYVDRGEYVGIRTSDAAPPIIQDLAHPLTTIMIKVPDDDVWMRPDDVPNFPVKVAMRFEPKKAQYMESFEHIVATTIWMIDTFPASYFLMSESGTPYFYSVGGETVLMNRSQCWVGGDGSDLTTRLRDHPWRWAAEA